jgi:NAD(P)H-hydrate epimerase
MKLLNAAQMQRLDRRTIDEIGLPGVVLMENAGRGVVEAIEQRFAPLRGSACALVLAGKGNNGGDGYVVARLLHDRGWRVRTVVLAERAAIAGDAKITLAALERCGGTVQFVTTEAALNSLLDAARDAGLVVDALFGTGLAKSVSGLAAVAIDWINGQTAPVVAVDIPSGVDASTGRILGCAVAAALTVSFALAKIGHASFPGAACTGELVVADIGLPRIVTEQAAADCRLIDAAEAKRLLPERSREGHKGTFGHLLVVAGSAGKCGAAVLATEAGLRSGAGLVTLACPHAIQPIVASRLTEAMTAAQAEVNGELSMQALDTLLELVAQRQALALGPGLGLGEEAAALVRRLVRDSDRPLVIDADAITALGDHLHVLERRHDCQTVLTPHPGEMQRLTGLTVAQIQADRFNVAREFAMTHKVALVLKGAASVVAAPDGRVSLNSSGHAGMASGGMGDVLTGIVGSLLAQGLDAFAAATLGVYLHGLAADRLLQRFGDAGLLAGDVVDELPAARWALSERD